VRVALFGAHGKVGAIIGLALEAHAHEVTRIDRGDTIDVAGHDTAVDFTRPDAVEANVRVSLEQRVPVVIGTSGFDLASVDAAAREANLPCFYAPNFAIGAVLMMRFAAQAAALFPRVEIVELHNEAKVDAPSGTAVATADLIGGKPAIHSVRLPGLVAHQEVLFGGDGQLLTIRHDTLNREAYVPGVLIALEKVRDLPPGLTVGLDRLL
jgi:4-hydroxy-tetrahydrodipicolinate reductase